MNISYNWLKSYLPFEMSPREVADALTSIGLETGGVEEFQSIKGGLQGLVIGEVLTCIDHPNSDHLHLTTVDVGDAEPLRIVCGAPNVAAGQKVVVAVIGTTLYSGDETFVIKRSKIRGEESFGMICAEDEIGVGTGHEGIMVLPAEAEVGTPAAAYFRIEEDHVLEVDITPNRVDATSHFGVARDLAAYLKQKGTPVALARPSVEAFKIDEPTGAISVAVENPEACIRYSGLTMRGVTVKESPDWLKNRLLAIGLRPINNIVDITNFILHELGQPLHAFDASKIKGDRVIVRTEPAGTRFVTLDEVERTLTDQDLMISNESEPMCIAGVFGGLDSGVTTQSTDLFLESACFHPAWVRRTARRFALNTDSSFRFERGLDANQTVYALRRAALMIQELAGGRIVGEIQDIYPEEVKPYPVEITYHKINTLIGKVIPPDTVKSILTSLEMTIVAESPEGLSLLVPVYRFDVRRDVDVIEDILRIYGYNNISFDDHLKSTLSYLTPTDARYQLENLISEQLCGSGFHEVLNNSFTRHLLYEGLTAFPAERSVMIMNPLSSDLNCMRQTLLFGGLQNIAYNVKRRNKNLYLFEFGNCYSFDETKKGGDDPLAPYHEDYRLGLWITGQRIENSWAHGDQESSIYELKAHVENILDRIGVARRAVVWEAFSDEIYSSGAKVLTSQGVVLCHLGVVHDTLLTQMDLEGPVYYAELLWDALIKEGKKKTISFSEISKYPVVKRDLALLLDQSITFAEIEKVAFDSERKLLKEVVLFDVYEGRILPEGKKSYAVSFYLQDVSKTLTDKQIDAIMSKVQSNLEKHLGAQLR